MAIDVCSEIPSLGASPRISFSYDLRQTDPIRSDPSLFDPSFNFDIDFYIDKSFGVDLRSADELFSNGKILPVEIKKQVSETKETHPSSVCENAKEKKRLKEFLSSDFDDDDDEVKPMPKFFGQFRRSMSMNCETGRSKSLIRSLHFLSRSNSTGSKQRVVLKDTQKHNSFKPPPLVNSQSSSSSFSYYSPYNSWRRPPLNKNCRSYGNGGRVSPVLNIPHNCIAIGNVSLFGFGSFFCNGKAKNKKK